MTASALATNCALSTEASAVRGWRRWAARLSLLLTIFAVLQPALAAPVGTGPLRYTDVSLKAGSGGGARHDHDHTLCHSCPGHICLEQHGSLDQTPIPLLALPAAYALLMPSVRVVLWPHPATAPQLRRIAQAPQARAPPLLA